MKNALLLIAILAGSLTPSLFGQTSLVLSPLAVGGGNFPGPFFVYNDQAPSVRFQQVYGQSDFSRFAQQFLITDVMFKRGSQSSGLSEINLPHINIDLSTTTKAPDGLSTTFAENVGSDPLTVFSGSLDFFDTGSSTFGYHIVLQRRFLYDTAKGNLLVDIRNFQTPNNPFAGFPYLGAEFTLGDTVSSVSSADVTSLTGGAATIGLDTLFGVTIVPEPSTVVFFVFGGAFLGITVLNRQRKLRGSN